MMNCPANLMAHLAAALPNHMAMEVVDAGWEQVLKTEARVEDGHIVLTNQPGLGIEFDGEQLKQRSVDSPSPHAGPSPFGRRKGAGLWEIGPDEAIRDDLSE